MDDPWTLPSVPTFTTNTTAYPHMTAGCTIPGCPYGCKQ